MGKLKKKYLFLLIIVIIGIVMGLLFANILSVDDQKIVYVKLTDFFNNIKNDIPIDYVNNLLSSIKNNVIYLGCIMVFGISIIGLVLNNFILFFKSFVLGFSIGSIISIYLYQGLVLAFIYCFPSLIINLLIFLIAVYYANDFSLKLFEVLFRKKSFNFELYIKKYFKIFAILLIILIISSLFETFLTPFLLKLFSFLIK